MKLTDAQKVDIGLAPAEGIYLYVSSADYFKWPYLSKSALTAFCISPAQHRAVVDEIIKWKSSDALLLGDATDVLWFYGLKAYLAGFAEEPAKPPLKKNGKPYSNYLTSSAGKAWIAQQEISGKKVLSKALWIKARAMAARLDEHKGRDGHPSARELRDQGIAQVSLVWRCPHTKIWLKGRPDIVDFERRVLTDLKTARDVRRWGFAKAISEYDYHWQARLYLQALAILTGTDPLDWIAKYIAVRNEPIHSVQIYTLSTAALEQAEREVSTKLVEYLHCAMADNWCGRWPAETGYEETIDLAAWRRKNA